MFTGLIECTGTIAKIVEQAPGVRLEIQAPNFAGDNRIGDSVAVSGCCLTIVEIDGNILSFEAGSETLSKTILGQLETGNRVNLEHSLTVGQPLGGHFVTGHVDGVGKLNQRIDEGDWSTFWFSVPSELSRQLANKGSIAVDGVSLTLVKVDEEQFSVALIPHTLKVTTLGALQINEAVNLETDILAKYVERYLTSTNEQR